MSTKSDHHDDARGSVLKKAVSFRNDLKSRITRKSSSAFTENTISKPVKKKTSFTRSGSFNDNDTVTATVKKNNDGTEKLGMEISKVTRGLDYIQGVVDKGIFEQFHGSVSIVLEQIAELKSIIQKSFPNQESSVLRSEFGALHQNLAKLMGLSDPLLLSSEKTFINKQEATDLISSIKNSIHELVHLVKENAESPTKSHKCSSENRNDVAAVIDSNFESDLSMTVDDPDDASYLDLSKNSKSRSAENLIIVCQAEDSSVDEVDGSISADVLTDVPPPKPPLPHYLWNVGKFNSMPKGFSFRHIIEELPPPLPEKKRNSAGIYEPNVTSNRLPVSFSQNLAVPYCHSPTNSVSSAFSASSEEILDDPPPKPSRILNSGFDRRDSRSSQYDNMNDSSFEHSSPTDFEDITGDGQLLPPPLPAKKGSTSCAGGGICLGSPYDNVFEHTSSSVDVVSTTVAADGNSDKFFPTLTPQFLSSMPTTSLPRGEVVISSTQAVRSYVSKVSEVHKKTYSSKMVRSHIIRSSEVNYSEVSGVEGSHGPPPIPPKKHVHAYLCAAFGERASMSSSNVRHSMHTTSLYGMCPPTDESMGMWDPQSFPSRVTSLQSSFPFNYADPDGISALRKSSSEDSDLNPPLPPKQRDQSSSRTTLDSGYYSNAAINHQANIPEGDSVEIQVQSPDSDSKLSFSRNVSSVSDVSKNCVASETTSTSEEEKLLEVNVLEEEEVTSRLVFNPPNEDGPEVRGGSVDALIVYATTPGQSDFQFQEAFLMTYRTFISPCDLIKKLLQRYNKFSKTDDIKKKKLARNAFSFLIRVVDDLCRETNKELLQILMELVYQLLNDGELQMAKTMRKQVLDKCENYRVKQAASHSTTLLSSYRLTTKSHSIIDFKTVSIAEQMTLLDAELFNKIEIPEVLRWSREQSEEHSPNLTKFTEHFNKMSYWCRTRILEQEEPKERERHLMKFIKVMKHLRRLNNFNSYLAILSAVDSAPVRRLEWQKQNVEALKEFCELIDSSSSFRAYRQALAEATPPCIPYIGLVLQDLTFVNIGNLDYLPDRNINFSKCWQYFSILQNMSCFRKCNYEFKKNEKITAFFNNFDYYLSEESLWQLSEMIKPRGSKTPAKQMD